MGEVPPLFGVAVNVTLFPMQTLGEDAAMLTVGTMPGVTESTILLLVAEPVAKQVALLVSIQVTISLLFRAEEENVGLLVPWLMPFTCH